MTIRYVDPLLTVHPLRYELTDDDMIKIIERVHNDDVSLSFDQLEAATDYLYDVVAGNLQTVEGVTTLQ